MALPEAPSSSGCRVLLRFSGGVGVEVLRVKSYRFRGSVESF